MCVQGIREIHISEHPLKQEEAATHFNSDALNVSVCRCVDCIVFYLQGMDLKVT